ncbi:DUF4031 domain-containing protein [Alloyangia pacifica]|uniref:DUF4031 domain-containing protein n=1 Tax=Alloyangia pacifica TaxID=311180 RepID=UPI0031E31A39
MTVYVDDMYRTAMGRFRHMKMSHMIADSTDELLAMADQIGLKRNWLQKASTADEHFDIGMGLRAKAVAAGAFKITMRDLATKSRARRSPP